MNSTKTLTKLLPCLIVLTLPLLAQLAQAQNSPQDYLDAHNTARAVVGVGNIMWSEQLVAYAQNFANQRMGDCILLHPRGAYGENLAWGSGDSLTGTGAVQLWVIEKANYDYNSNTCAQGNLCGHYTQMVWRNSDSLGCARAQCNNNLGTFVICCYNPPGNINGQKPY